jgi:hypothetical protein
VTGTEDIWSPNGALTGAYSGTGARKAARFPEKNPARCETMRSQRSRPGSRSTGEAAGTSGDLRPATRRDIAPHRATSKTGGGGTMQAAQGEAGTGTKRNKAKHSAPLQACRTVTFRAKTRTSQVNHTDAYRRITLLQNSAEAFYPSQVNHTETPNRRRATRPARNISQHSRNPPPGIRGILSVVPPQTGVYAADAYRPGSDEWQQCTGNKAVSRGARESVTTGSSTRSGEGEGEPVSWADSPG